MHIIPALGRRGQEDHEFEDSLGYIVQPYQRKTERQRERGREEKQNIYARRQNE
jgi:hypothetical protein